MYALSLGLLSSAFPFGPTCPKIHLMSSVSLARSLPSVTAAAAASLGHLLAKPWLPISRPASLSVSPCRHPPLYDRHLRAGVWVGRLLIGSLNILEIAQWSSQGAATDMTFYPDSRWIHFRWYGSPKDSNFNPVSQRSSGWSRIEERCL